MSEGKIQNYELSKNDLGNVSGGVGGLYGVIHKHCKKCGHEIKRHKTGILWDGKGSTDNYTFFASYHQTDYCDSCMRKLFDEQKPKNNLE